jgi:hypothetical protein
VWRGESGVPTTHLIGLSYVPRASMTTTTATRTGGAGRDAALVSGRYVVHGSLSLRLRWPGCRFAVGPVLASSSAKPTGYSLDELLHAARRLSTTASDKRLCRRCLHVSSDYHLHARKKPNPYLSSIVVAGAYMSPLITICMRERNQTSTYPR